MTSNTTCDECGGNMQEGYVLDVAHGGVLPSIWVEGKPESSLWSGLKTKGKNKYWLIDVKGAGL